MVFTSPFSSKKGGMNAEFECRYKNLKVLRESFVGLRSKATDTMKVLQNYSIAMEGVGGHFCSIAACLKHGGSDVTVGEYMSPGSVTVCNESATSFERSTALSCEQRLPSVEPELAQEVLESAQSFTAEMRNMREGSAYRAFQAGVVEDVQGATDKILGTISAGLHKGKVARQRMDAYFAARTVVEEKLQKYEKAGKDLALSKNHAVQVRERDQAESIYVTALQDFNIQYDSIRSQVQEFVVCTMDRFLDHSVIYMQVILNCIDCVTPDIAQNFPPNCQQVPTAMRPDRVTLRRSMQAASQSRCEPVEDVIEQPRKKSSPSPSATRPRRVSAGSSCTTSLAQPLSTSSPKIKPSPDPHPVHQKK